MEAAIKKALKGSDLAPTKTPTKPAKVTDQAIMSSSMGTGVAGKSGILFKSDGKTRKAGEETQMTSSKKIDKALKSSE